MNNKIIEAILGILLFGLAYFAYTTWQDNKYLKAIAVQNELALKDSLKVLKYKNSELYHKLVFVQDTDSLKNDLLKKRNEEIVALTKTVIKLNNIISSGEGNYTDTVLITKCDGLKLTFKNKTPFYKYDLDVIVGTPPKHQLSLAFNPFKITSYLTRNDEGIWSTYLEVPDSLKTFIQINDVETILSKDEYMDKLKSTFEFGLIPTIGMYSDFTDKFDITLGLGVQLNNHFITYQKAINIKEHFLTYGYRFKF